MNFVDSIKSGFKNCFRYSGRASRSEYWYFYLFILLLLSFLGFVLPRLVPIIAIIIIVPTIALQIWRYHDVGLSGKLFLTIVVIGVGVVLGVLGLVAEGHLNERRYVWAVIVSISCFIINFIIICKRPSAGDNEYGSNSQKTPAQESSLRVLFRQIVAIGEKLKELYEKLKKLYKETKTEIADEKFTKQYTNRLTDVRNMAYSKNKTQTVTKKGELAKIKAKSDIEIRLAQIENMFERSVITKTERDELREKALGLD